MRQHRFNKKQNQEQYQFSNQQLKTFESPFDNQQQKQFGSEQQQQVGSQQRRHFGSQKQKQPIAFQRHQEVFNPQQPIPPNNDPSQFQQPRPNDVQSGGYPHPGQLLNQLSKDQQQTFLNQFAYLSPDQQNYAYRKFLSTPSEIQQFAINQFLSLDPEVLALSLQEETTGIHTVHHQRVFQHGQQSQLNTFQGEQFQSNPREVTTTTQQQEEALKESLLSALQRATYSENDANQ